MSAKSKVGQAAGECAAVGLAARDGTVDFACSSWSIWSQQKRL